jgi:hypothetical protein
MGGNMNTKPRLPVHSSRIAGVFCRRRRFSELGFTIALKRAHVCIRQWCAYQGRVVDEGHADVQPGLDVASAGSLVVVNVRLDPVHRVQRERLHSVQTTTNKHT